MKKLVVALFAGGAIFGTVFAFAAALNVVPNQLGAGDADVSSCQGTTNVTTGYTVKYDATYGYVVDKVSVAGIVAGCSDATVYVTISDGTNNASVSGLVPAFTAPGFTVIGAPNPVVARLVGTNNLHVAIVKP